MEALKVCVDTDIIIDYLRGRNENQDILPHLIAKHDVYISPVSVYELYYGGYYSGKSAQIHAALSKAGETLNVLLLAFVWVRG